MEPDRKDSTEPLHISIEQDGKNKYKIQTDQLERIGSQLRGRRQFSVFNSIVLPVIVTILTTLLTGMFQYVSWTNSVRLQNATEQASKASEAYDHAASAIAKRRYASLLFIPTVRDLARTSQEKPEIVYHMAEATNGGNPTSVPNPADPPIVGPQISLSVLSRELLKSRYEAYYKHLKNWNESYDQILTEIDYNLDRPVLLQAQQPSVAIRVFQVKFKDMDCSQSLTEQLNKLKLNKHSLKLQFAAIQHCFMRLNSRLGEIVKSSPHVNQALLDKANNDLGDVYTMYNEFRCFAQRRIDYYHRQKELSILSPRLVVRRLLNTQKADALAHFDFTAERCNPENRPV